MKLSIAEAATVLNKSDRQIRYSIRQGKLPARKENNRWRIDSSDLPLDEKTREAMRLRLTEARRTSSLGASTRWTA